MGWIKEKQEEQEEQQNKQGEHIEKNSQNLENQGTALVNGLENLSQSHSQNKQHINNVVKSLKLIKASVMQPSVMQGSLNHDLYSDHDIDAHLVGTAAK